MRAAKICLELMLPLAVFVSVNPESAKAAEPPRCASLFSIEQVARGAGSHSGVQSLAQARSQSRAKIRDLRERILHLRDLEPLPDPAWERNRWRVSDRDSAERIFNYIVTRANKTDLEIFQTVLSTVELTQGRHNVSGLDPGEDFIWPLRPKTYLFNEGHWNFGRLTDYFFNGAPKLTVTKQRDLEYLKKVLAVAKERPNQAIDDVLTEADLRWHMKTFEREPKLSADFLRWKAGRSLDTIRREQASKLARWNQAKRLASSRFFRENTRSYLDLYLMDRYLSLVREAGFEAANVEVAKASMIEWRVLSEGLASGDVGYFADFLLETSHDSARKVFLLKVLDQLSDQKAKQKFADEYKKAFREVESRAPDIQAPPNYESDIHIFGMTGADGLYPILNPFETRVPRGRIEDPHAVHVRAGWNKKLGQLDVVVEESVRLESPKTTILDVLPKVQPLVDEYFKALGSKGAVTAAQLQNQKSREYATMITRTTFIIATLPGQLSADSVVGMGRIFYGGPRSLEFRADSNVFEVGGEKTFIELDYPKFELPSRKLKEDAYEFGRLWTTKLAAPNSRFKIVNFMADVLDNAGARGTAYMDGGAASKRMYELMGANVVAGPSELGIPEGYKPIWLLGASIQKIRKDYLTEQYESVRLQSAPDKK